MSANGNTTHSVSAAREYILAAVAVHTPQILQLSGIGPKSLLSGLGIETLVDLPVGYNFQDQPVMFVSWTCGLNLRQNVENSLLLTFALDGSGYPFPAPEWLFSNQTWAVEQLEIYYKNRTGTFRIRHRWKND